MENTMELNTDRFKKLLTLIPLCCITTTLSASPLMDNITQGKFLLQVGGFSASNQGKAQQINIQTLIGDYFSVSNNRNQNALFGIGYFVDGQHFNSFNMQYGVNAFYFMDTTVNGNITQEQLFTNLGYSYDTSNLPVYATAKGLFNLKNERYHLVIDAGIGPNFKQTSNFSERSLDGGVTIPEQPFTGKTNVTFSAMTGIGFKIDHAIDKAPLECGYHIFYLGRGQFNTTTNQVLNSLKTGNSYAQALTCGISL
jgi:hypothetical protein